MKLKYCLLQFSWREEKCFMQTSACILSLHKLTKIYRIKLRFACKHANMFFNIKYFQHLTKTFCRWSLSNRDSFLYNQVLLQHFFLLHVMHPPSDTKQQIIFTDCCSSLTGWLHRKLHISAGSPLITTLYCRVNEKTSLKPESGDTYRAAHPRLICYHVLSETASSSLTETSVKHLEQRQTPSLQLWG